MELSLESVSRKKGFKMRRVTRLIGIVWRVLLVVLCRMRWVEMRERDRGGTLARGRKGFRKATASGSGRKGDRTNPRLSGRAKSWVLASQLGVGVEGERSGGMSQINSAPFSELHDGRLCGAINRSEGEDRNSHSAYCPQQRPDGSAYLSEDRCFFELLSKAPPAGWLKTAAF